MHLLALPRRLIPERKNDTRMYVVRNGFISRRDEQNTAAPRQGDVTIVEVHDGHTRRGMPATELGVSDTRRQAEPRGSRDRNTSSHLNVDLVLRL